MAVTWGSYSQRAQIGIDVSMSPATVTSATSSVTLTWTAYIRTTYAYSHTGTFVRTGTGPTGSSSFTLTTPNGATTTRTVGSWQQTVSTSYAGTVSRSLTAVFPGSGTLFDGGKPTHTRSFTVPRRPPGAPSAPTSATQSMLTATSARVTWVRPGNYNSDATRWANAVVSRAMDSGSYVDVATVAASVTSWNNTGLQANRRYRYRVQGSNVTARSSATAATPTWLYTTPANPTGLSLVKVGDDVRVHFTNNAPWATSFEVEDQGVGVVATGASSPVLVESPNPAVPHRYRVRAITPGGTVSGWSAWSSILQLQAPPNAPTWLIGNGTVIESTADVILPWQHNPVDATTQTERHLRYRLVGAGSWTESTTSTSSQQIDLGTLAAGSYEAQVRTRGAHVDWSPFSAVVTFTVAVKPVVTITAPSGTIDGASTVVEWTYFQADSQPQTAWQVDALVDGSPVVESGVRPGADDSWLTPATLPDASSPTIRVRARSSVGLWSDWTTASIDVVYDEPPAPTIEADWNEHSASVTVDAAMQAGDPETVLLIVERSIGGQEWVEIGRTDEPTIQVHDFEAPLTGHLRYRAVAVSALPSQSFTEATVTSPHDLGDHSMCAIWINAGPEFRASLKIQFDPQHRFTGGRVRHGRWYAGRRRPMYRDSLQMPLSITVTGTLLPKDHDAAAWVDPEQIITFFRLPGPFLYRDPHGVTKYVSPSGESFTPGGVGRIGDVAVTLTETDRGTDEQLASLAAYAGAYIVELTPGEYIIVGGDVIMAGPGEFELVP